MSSFYKIILGLLGSFILVSSCQKASISEPTQEWIRFFGACAVQNDGEVEGVDLIYSPDLQTWALASTFSSQVDNADSLWLILTDSIGQLIKQQLFAPNEVYPYAKNLQNTSTGYILSTNDIEDISDASASNAMLAEFSTSGNLIRTQEINAGGTDNYYISDMIQDAEGNIYITGVTTAIDTTKVGWISNYDIIDKTDAFIAKLDADWNIVWDTVVGTFHGDYGLSLGQKDSILWVGLSLGENNPSGSNIGMMRLSTNTGAKIGSYTFSNTSNVYPNHLAFLDDGSWMVLYIPINSLTFTYELKLFTNDSSFYDYALDIGDEPNYIMKDRLNNFILGGTRDGQAQFWLADPTVGGLITKQNGYGIPNSSDYQTSLSKFLLKPDESRYFYILGEQIRPFPSSTISDDCKNLMFMRVGNPAI